MSITNDQIILAAITAAGARPDAPVKADFPGDPEAYAAALARFEQQKNTYDQKVKESARDIKVMLSDRSAVTRQLTALDKAMDENSTDGKVFIGTVTEVRLEQRSTRAVITLFTGTSMEFDGIAPGHETVRTERTDNPDGRAMARSAQLLIGHRVTAYVELEQLANNKNKKSRVIRHLEDLGVDARWDAETRSMTASPVAAAA